MANWRYKCFSKKKSVSALFYLFPHETCLNNTNVLFDTHINKTMFKTKIIRHFLKRDFTFYILVNSWYRMNSIKFTFYWLKEVLDLWKSPGRIYGYCYHLLKHHGTSEIDTRLHMYTKHGAAVEWHFILTSKLNTAESFTNGYYAFLY